MTTSTTPVAADDSREQQAALVSRSDPATVHAVSTQGRPDDSSEVTAGGTVDVSAALSATPAPERDDLPSELVLDPVVRVVRGIGRIPVVNVSPVIEGGAYPAKAVVGELFKVSANVFREGHDNVAASVVLTSPQGREIRTHMTQVWPQGLDIWEAWVRPDEEGPWTFRVEGWSDPWGTWLHNAEAKLPLSMDVDLMCQEARQLFARAARRAEAGGVHDDARSLTETGDAMQGWRPVGELLETVESAGTAALMKVWAPRELVTPTAEFPLFVDRRRALYSSWYEFFPRSQGAHHVDGHWVSGTLDSSHERLEAAAAMGFDIIYVPPIHPIGFSYRKGPNNTLTPDEFDPGSPWAIGAASGGHDAIHPELGDFDAFDRFVAKTRSLGMEVALDFALQASPDHPWVHDHPEWFTTRLDGSIAFAENPPKKYQDIYPINFDNDPVGIYHECLRLLLFWIDKGVTVFRVDNPHTKPVQFWAWLLHEIRLTHPEVLFLAEAFTRPEMMWALGKIGFHQSYTYFTWRTSKQELSDYITELSTRSDSFFRPNFFVNTPDINPRHLQSGNSAAFAIRAILAATLSPSWGVYSGFELFEHSPLKPGGEEYLDSEKFQYRPRDYTAEPNLSLLLGRLNEIRASNPALQQLRTVTIHQTPNDQVLAFSKWDGDSRVIVVVSLDPDNTQSSEVILDFEAIGLPDWGEVDVVDELSGESWRWTNRSFVRLYPAQPAHILRVTPA